jgi:hypothetical protein
MNVLLTVSSCLFLIPAILAWHLYQPFFAILSLITSLISINYWRNPVPGIRKNADLIFAKISFAFYFRAMMSKIHFTYIFGLLCVSTCLLVTCYMLSCYFSQKKTRTPSQFQSHLNTSSCVSWVYFHFVFHLLVTCNQCIIILILDYK